MKYVFTLALAVFACGAEECKAQCGSHGGRLRERIEERRAERHARWFGGNGCQGASYGCQGGSYQANYGCQGGNGCQGGTVQSEYREGERVRGESRKEMPKSHKHFDTLLELELHQKNEQADLAEHQKKERERFNKEHPKKERDDKPFDEQEPVKRPKSVP